MKKRVAILAFAVLLFFPAVTRAESELEELKRIVAQQQLMIKELQSTVRELVAAQKQMESTRKAAVPQTEVALPPAAPETAGTQGVSVQQVENIVESLERKVGSKLLLSGYGAASFLRQEHDNSTFEGNFNPIFLYKMDDDLQFTGEIEVQLRDDSADFDLEQAAINYFVHDNITLVAGKFLLPFNQFSERIHPYWINKLPSFAPIYSDEQGNGRPGLIPLLSDAGIQTRGGVELGDEMRMNYALYLVNGPEAVSSDQSQPTPPDLDFGANFSDNNMNKTFGGRLGFQPVADTEIGWSGMGGRYGDGETGFFLWGADGVAKSYGWELRGEYADLRIDSPDFGDEHRDGYYVQVAYRPGLATYASAWPLFARKLELVARVGRAETVDGAFTQWSPGVIYWLKESVPFKLGYEFNSADGELGYDRFLAQLAFGF